MLPEANRENTGFPAGLTQRKQRQGEVLRHGFLFQREVVQLKCNIVWCQFNMWVQVRAESDKKLG